MNNTEINNQQHTNSVATYTSYIISLYNSKFRAKWKEHVGMSHKWCHKDTGFKYFHVYSLQKPQSKSNLTTS